jgi:ribonuclease P protein subunit POP4
MYEPLNSKLLDELADKKVPKRMVSISTSSRPLNMDVHEDRDIFVDQLLTSLLGEEKLKEKSAIADKLKYKKHQLEVASKQMRKEAKAKREQNQPSKSWSQRKRLVLNSKTKKKLGMYKISKSDKLDYSKYLKTNEIWHNYAASCLLTCMPKTLPADEVKSLDVSMLNEESALNCLKQIDYHGSLLTVTRSNCRTLVGLSGIVLQDKKNVFLLLTRNNEIKIVSKAGSLFELELFGCVKITLVGSNMLHKPEMRITKHARIKTKVDIL